MKGLKTSVLALSVALAALSSSAFAAPNQCDVNGRIDVVGTGEVKVMPDVVSLNFRVTSLNKSAEEARAEVEKNVKAFADEVAKLKLDKNAFISDNISIMSRYKYEKEERILLGYEAIRNVEVKLTDFSLISKVTDLALKSGINGVDGFNYSVKDPKKYQDEAAQKAIVDAREQALMLSKGFDVKLDKPCSISFQRRGGAMPILYKAASARMADSAVESVYTAEPLTISVSVNASYAIK